MTTKGPKQHPPLILAAVCCTGKQSPSLPLKEQLHFSDIMN